MSLSQIGLSQWEWSLKFGQGRLRAIQPGLATPACPVLASVQPVRVLFPGSSSPAVRTPWSVSSRPASPTRTCLPGLVTSSTSQTTGYLSQAQSSRTGPLPSICSFPGRLLEPGRLYPAILTCFKWIDHNFSNTGPNDLKPLPLES